MEQYAKYLRKSRFDRDYAELSVEETLKRHEAILDKLAADRGYAVTKTYWEVVSGESIAARPMIQQLLEEVNQGLYAGVLVVDLERLARGNSADQAYISQVFQFSGTKIITPAKVYDPNDEFDQEYFEFGLFMSRREYKTITRRLIRGRNSSAAEGKYLGSIPPYGYQRIKLGGEKGYTLTPDPTEADTVRQIFRLYINGDGVKKIAQTLNSQGVPTRHGDAWTYSTISHILENPVYMGKIRRGAFRQVKSVENGQVKKRVQRVPRMADYAVYEGLHPPLIDGETFARAQEIRADKRPPLRAKKAYPLQNAFAGLIFCARCGSRVARTTLSLRQGGKARMKCVRQSTCGNASADYGLVEAEILRALRAWTAGYRLNLRPMDFAEEIQSARRQRDRWAREEEKILEQLENAYNLVEQGVYTPALFQERQAALNKQAEEANAKRTAAEEEAARLEKHSQQADQWLPQTEELLDSYEDLTPEEKNKLLHTILQKITYWKGPEGRVEIDLYPRLPRL